MTKQEFLDKWDEETLRKLHFIVDQKDFFDYSFVCYFDEKWKVVRVEERGIRNVWYEGDEEFVFTKLNELVESEQRDYIFLESIKDRRKISFFGRPCLSYPKSTTKQIE